MTPADISLCISNYSGEDPKMKREVKNHVTQIDIFVVAGCPLLTT